MLLESDYDLQESSTRVDNRGCHERHGVPTVPSRANVDAYSALRDHSGANKSFKGDAGSNHGLSYLQQPSYQPNGFKRATTPYNQPLSRLQETVGESQSTSNQFTTTNQLTTNTLETLSPRGVDDGSAAHLQAYHRSKSSNQEQARLHIQPQTACCN